MATEAKLIQSMTMDGGYSFMSAWISYQRFSNPGRAVEGVQLLRAGAFWLVIS